MDNGVSYTTTKPLEEFEINKKNKPSGLIGRQDAIDAIYKESRCANSEVADEYADMFVYAIKTLPSAQKTGEWIDGTYRQTCSVCRYRGMRSWQFCPSCGAYMESEGKE